jgi:hypothetical protein
VLGTSGVQISFPALFRSMESMQHFLIGSLRTPDLPHCNVQFFENPGIRVEICGPAGCHEKSSMMVLHAGQARSQCSYDILGSTEKQIRRILKYIFTIEYANNYINPEAPLYSMEGIGLKVQVRAVPSRGRVRVNESVLGMLEIEQGSNIDLYSSPDAKPLTVSVYADAMVDKGVVRMDAGDVEKLGLREGSVVTATKTPKFSEKVKSATSRTTQSVSEGVSSVSRRITGKHEETEEQEKPDMQKKSV